MVAVFHAGSLTRLSVQEAKAAFEVVTSEVARAKEEVGKLHRLIVLSEGVSKDETFARQARRKVVL